MRSQAEKARAFRALHQGPMAFVIPNPWDAGTARLLELVGFPALATTSAGFAFSTGKPDNAVGREAILANVSLIVRATDLPVSADLENCFSDDPREAAQTIGLAAAAGAAGASIEDMAATRAIYALEHATERVRAAAEAAHALPFPFMLTARAENYLCGRPDLRDTIRRLQAYQEAGADVLYAPGLTRREDIAEVVRSVDRPVNVLAGSAPFTVAELSAVGVRRISVGGALSRAALGAFLRAAREMKEKGSFTFAADAVSFKELTEMFSA